MKTWQTALAIFVALSASFTLADDFKTLDGVADCIVDGVRLAVPQATEWQRTGNLKR